jgi:PAS domain S-box-containing protein
MCIDGPITAQNNTLIRRVLSTTEAPGAGGVSSACGDASKAGIEDEGGCVREQPAHRQSDELLRLFIDGTGEYALVMLDAKGLIRFWNEGARRLWGYETDEITGRHFSLFHTSDDVRAGWPERALETALGNGKFEEEGERLRKDGTPFWASTLITPLFDETGDLKGFSQVDHDISERKRIGQELAELTSRLRAIVDTAIDAIIVIDEAGTVQSVNPAVQRIFGYSASEVVGSNVSLLMPGVHRDAHDGHIAAYRRTGAAKIIGIGREVEGQRKDGTVFPADLAIAEWTVAGKRCFTGILRDITERKREVEAMKAAQAEAERANEAKSRFLAAASHDLRQPIQAMLLLYERLEREMTTAGQREVLGRFGKSLCLAEAFLDDLFDVGQIDSGGVSVRPERVAPGKIVRNLVAELAPMAANKGLDLRVFARDDGIIDSDPFLLRRVLFNLVINAIRYTETGGVLVGMRRRSGSMAFEVWDSGIGIASEVQELVFDEYYQVANASHDRTKGTGLGLAIVRRLCGLLGYKVDLASRPGRGSVFRVTVPLACPAWGQGSVEVVLS